MTTAGPWSVKGIDPKARELAKDLAHRSGMTLGEWLNRMIIEGDAEDEPEVATRSPYAEPLRPASREIRLSSGAELQRVARALDALTARMEAAEHRSTLAISGIDQSVMGVLSRIEGVERDRNAVAARFDNELDEVKAAQAKVAERLRRIGEEDGSRLEAMRALEGALGKIAEKLHDSETKTRTALSDVQQDVAHAVRRVDRVESRIEADPAANLVDAVVARIGERLAEAETRTAEAMRAMETSFAGLDQRLKATEAVADEDSPERRFERLAADLHDKIESNRAELTERLNAAADGKLDRMESTLRELAGHVEQGERRSAQAIDRMGREVMRIAQTLGERVGSVEARTADAAQQMGGEMARIAEAMEQRLGRADSVQTEALEKLGGEIAKIAERLADRIASSERRSAAAFDDVGEQIGRVTERLNDRYEASQGVLAERIKASEDRTAKLLDEARESIDRRLMEAQRRAVLEGVAETQRQIAEEAAPGRTAAKPFLDDPFATLDAPAPMRAAATFPEPEPFVSAEPFKPTESFAAEEAFGQRYGGPGADAVTGPAVSDARSTRDVVAAARAAARASSDRPEPLVRGKRDALARSPGLAGSVAAPALEGEKGGFSFSMPKRKKKEAGVTLRTMVVASGTAAALAVTAVGATLYLGAESGPSGQHVDRSSPPPTAARSDDSKTLAAEATAAPAATAPSADTPQGTGVSDTAPAETLAMAIAPAPGETQGLRLPAPAKGRLPALAPAPATSAAANPAPAAKPVEARPLYNTAIGRLQSGDVGGVEDLRKAANLGFAPAQFYLAKLYESGGSGIKKDLGEARRWTERAAQAGDPKAMHNLALYEFNGEGGAKDQADATHWFRKAADQGIVDSQYNLGRLYENGGYGVPQNKVEAYKWYLVAAAQGDKDAKASADAVKSQLPADQAAAAERTALAFRTAKTPALETAKQ
jgi:localization factor PodJL